MNKLTCFKAYDIRGRLGEELNEQVAYNIGRAFSVQLKPKSVVIGGDARATSRSLVMAMVRGLNDGGTDVLDLGLTGTEEIYFATSHLGVDGGIEVTASHNPINYNGMKLVERAVVLLVTTTACLRLKLWLSKHHGKIKRLRVQEPVIRKLTCWMTISRTC